MAKIQFYNAVINALIPINKNAHQHLEDEHFIATNCR